MSWPLSVSQCIFVGLGTFLAKNKKDFQIPFPVTRSEECGQCERVFWEVKNSMQYQVNVRSTEPYISWKVFLYLTTLKLKL